MKSKAYYFVNAISAYRLLAAFVLFWLIYADRLDIFKWMIAISFFTDMADGYLARKLKVQSEFGSRLDSVGDDLTVVAGLAGIYFFRRGFLEEQMVLLSILFGLFLFQMGLAFYRYGKTSSFHTYLAKFAALFQGSFMILLFFMEDPIYPLYYSTVWVTFVELAEEIIITLIQKEWKTDLKGLYWIIREKRDKKAE